MRIDNFTEECHGVTEARRNESISGENGGQPALSGFGFFDEGFLADDNDDAGIGDVEAAAVGFEVVADLGALGEADVAGDDGSAGRGMAAAVYRGGADGIRPLG